MRKLGTEQNENNRLSQGKEVGKILPNGVIDRFYPIIRKKGAYSKNTQKTCTMDLVQMKNRSKDLVYSM